MIRNSNSLAVATEERIEVVCDFEKVGSNLSLRSHRTIKVGEEVLLMQSFQLPITQQSVLVGTTNKGSVLLYDMRSRQPIL